VPESTEQHLWVSWDEYHNKIEELALLIVESGWKFDQILCLARGGLRPGDVLSRIFDLPLAILSASSYRDEVGTKQGALDIASHITTTNGTLSGRLLVVDDLADSGVTLLSVVKHLSAQFTGLTEIKTAVIWQKACSQVTPDYFVDFLTTSPWIHQPFEDYETLRPDMLRERVQQRSR